MPKRKRRVGFGMRGDRLRSIRDMRGLSQPELGARVGVTGQQIYRYEKAENEPDADILAMLARELEVSADYLLGLVDDLQGHILK